MSQQNVEVVRGALEAFNRGDMAAALAPVDPAVEIYPPVEDPDMDDVYRGHDGALRNLEQWLEPWAEFRFEAEEFIDAGDRVVVTYSQRGRGKGSGVEIENRLTAVVSLRSGKIVRGQVYLDQAEALKAAGLRE
jgi:ketosteroid isomerase-like protein